MPLTLRDRILAWSITTTLLIVVAVVLLVDSTFRTTIRATLQESLLSGARLAGELHRSAVSDWITDVARVALEPTLRASLETSDPTTIGQLLDTARVNIRADWLAVLSPEGDLLAASGPVPTDRLTQTGPLLEETSYYDSGDLWVAGDTLTMIGASSVLFGQLRLGVLLGARRIDDARASELANGTGEDIAFLAGRRVAAVDTLIGPVRAPDLARLDWTGGAGAVRLSATDPMTLAPARELSVGGERFLSTALSLHASDSRRVGSMLVFRSLDAALGPVRRLRWILAAIGLSGLLIGLGMSAALTRSVAVPVRRLLDDTVRLGTGDLEQPIQPMARDEIGLLAEGFDQMRVSLRDARAEVIRRERLSAVGQAASALVHDFAQPVTVIGAHTEFLALGGEPGDQKEEIAAIREALRRLQAMMREVLEFARGEVRIEQAPVRVQALLEEVAVQARPLLEPKGIMLELSPGFPGEWTLDHHRTARALGNLVRNAASVLEKSGGTIALRSARRDGCLRLEVADDGPGIPPEIRATLFEPFVSRGKREGTGLGLAIVKNIAESQGGTASFTTSSEGTVFVLELPEGAATEARS